jgi:hypothetical protein
MGLNSSKNTPFFLTFATKGLVDPNANRGRAIALPSVSPLKKKAEDLVRSSALVLSP